MSRSPPFVATTGSGGAELDGHYRYLDLTGAEIADALTIDLPVTREPWMDTLYAAVNMHCECGEDTHEAMTWPTQRELECICGRIWIIEVTFRLGSQRAARQPI
jgi:hypothetical protein